MSGTAWQKKARRIVDEDLWPENVSKIDKETVVSLAKTPTPYEPYYTLKAVIDGILEGFYKPSRFSEQLEP